MKPVILLVGLVITASTDAAADRRVTLEASDMTCATCPVEVHVALEKVPGVTAATVDFESKLAVVAFDSAKTTPDALTNDRGRGIPVDPEAGPVT